MINLNQGGVMKRLITFLCCVFVVSLMGCAQQPKSANSGEAIKNADQLSTVQEKVNYLESEAKAFISQKRYDDALKTANYVLSKFQADAKEAQQIVERAKSELEALAKEKSQQMKGELDKKLGGLGQK